MKVKVKRDPRNLLTSLILVFPLFIIYQLGVVLVYPMINGADLLTRFLLHNVGLSRTGYLGATAAAAVVFVVAVAILRKRQQLQVRSFIPMLLESAIYALTMGSLIGLLMTRVLHMDPRLGPGLADQGLVSRLVMSIGAGVWEETVFRLGLLAGLAALGERVFGIRRPIALLGAFFISAFLFSAAHHIPPYGDPLRLGIFTYRFLAGIFFGLLFWFRGFAVAAYTHALYDLYVLVIHP